MSYIRAPFTEDQVQKLNENQVGLGGPVRRAFICRSSADHRHGVEGGVPGILIATKYGWVCPHCNYKRDWAFAIMATRLTRPATAVQSFVYTTPSIEKANMLLGQYERLATAERPGAAVMVACIKNRIEEMSLPGFGTIELNEIPTDAMVRQSQGRNYQVVSGQAHLQAALRLTGRALVTDAVTHEQLHVHDIDGKLFAISSDAQAVLDSETLTAIERAKAGPRARRA
ncbi:hypothetical protein [Cupriavidus numazuensis]|uniref:Uncharacterized protein n=1 Tax=Cupriavidus numazuensis TaxID=221992 RepID=A0ABM8TVQ4_9BURK|nr:hypothetical protein [Cupriavidus numazuensis]CAG2160795.1 hypothetical protein LMG26411_07768 [Cupriavidus numazuensis]